jgi:hypothetical protein
MAGALTFTAIPAHAIDSCTPDQTLIQEAQAAENEADTWVYAEDVFLDDDNYEAVNYARLRDLAARTRHS